MVRCLKVKNNKLKTIVRDVERHKFLWISFSSVSVCIWNIFLFQIHTEIDKSIPKSTITELYKNLLNETLKGARDLNFQAASDLILEVNFQMKRSTLLNRKRKKEDNQSNLKIKEERDFFEAWSIWGRNGRGLI